MRDRLGAIGATSAAAGIALAAFASHLAAPDDRARLFIAAALAFGNGLAAVALSPVARGRLARGGLQLAIAGMLLFCGSLALAVVAGTPTVLAPLGGIAMIAGWMLLAVARWRG
jgi:uncharacterized membrane protein YgdD (TMEM256/DUF423 family)